MIALGATLAATMRMVNRIHRNAAHVPALAEPSAAAGLADGDIFMLDVADLADSPAAFREHHPLLPRGKLQQRHLAFFGHQLRLRSRAARKLRARTRLHLDGVNDGSDRDVL